MRIKDAHYYSVTSLHEIEGHVGPWLKHVGCHLPSRALSSRAMLCAIAMVTRGMHVHPQERALLKVLRKCLPKPATVACVVWWVEDVELLDTWLEMLEGYLGLLPNGRNYAG